MEGGVLKDKKVLISVLSYTFTYYPSNLLLPFTFQETGQINRFRRVEMLLPLQEAPFDKQKETPLEIELQ